MALLLMGPGILDTHIPQERLKTNIRAAQMYIFYEGVMNVKRDFHHLPRRTVSETHTDTCINYLEPRDPV